MEEKMDQFMISMKRRMDFMIRQVEDVWEWVAGELFARDAEAEFEEEESEVESGGEPEAAFREPEELRKEVIAHVREMQMEKEKE